MTPTAGRLRSALQSLGSRTEYEASQERSRVARTGTTPVADLVDRRRAAVSGIVRNVMVRASQNAPVLEAELFDGSGSLRLLWIGQRRIGGVEPGRRMVVEGLVSFAPGQAPTLYNPRYELLADVDEGRVR